MKIIQTGIMALAATSFVFLMPISAHACHNKEELLKKFDTNGDGKLDKDEKKAAKAAIHAKRGHKKDATESTQNAAPSNPGSGPVNPL